VRWLLSAENTVGREEWAKRRPTLDGTLETTARAKSPGIAHSMQCLRSQLAKHGAMCLSRAKTADRSPEKQAYRGWPD
jgi:hypothetical protein